MVKQILNKFKIDYGGIDFTFHNGKAVFNEIEDAGEQECFTAFVT